MKIILALFAALLLTSPCRANVSTSSQALESLRLPSFSIFGFDEIKDPKFDVQYPKEELQKILAELRNVEKLKAVNASSKKSLAHISFVIPIVFYRSRRLFTQSEWSAQDIEEGQRISRFFARLTNKPELEIFSAQPGAFRDGLINLRNWYTGLCSHNPSLAEMMFTFDDGPYYGFPLPRARFSELKVLQSATLPGRTEKFALLTDGKTSNPLFLGVLAQNGAILWAQRLSREAVVPIGWAEMESDSCKKIEGSGYKCYVRAGEGSNVYLDENLKLRFFFVSW